MNDVWVCTDCKSINRERGGRGYRCGAKRETAASAAGPNIRLEAAAANRTARGYASSLAIAISASVLILGFAVLNLCLLIAELPRLNQLRDAFVEEVQTGGSARALQVAASITDEFAVAGAIRLGLLALAVLAFGLWLSRVVVNIPALGGGTPGWGPWKALLYPVIPLVNLVRVPPMIHDALYRLDPRGGGFFMVLLAWVGFAGSWIVDVVATQVIAAIARMGLLESTTLAGASRVFGRLLDQTLILSVVVEVMVTGGALVLVLIILRIERRAAARDREIRAALAGLAGLA